MNLVITILLILAALLFVIAAFQVATEVRKVNLVHLGLALLTIALLLARHAAKALFVFFVMLLCA